MTPCAIYLRTSVEESRGEFSMVNDLDLCRAHAAARGYTIVGEFNDVRSTGTLDRPGLTALRQALAAHQGGVMVIPREAALAPEEAGRRLVAEALAQERISVEVARPLADRAAAA
ncbi:MAG TPA: recombinase family protein [Roseiflexaceae bacterium]|nr:recombinase family protein [Roseiflexaceae bacterium]